MPKKMFVPKSINRCGERENLHNEYHSDLYSSFFMVTVFKVTTDIWNGQKRNRYLLVTWKTQEMVR
jgi:hypothetical protein